MTIGESKSHLDGNAAFTPSMETIRVLHLDDEDSQQMFLKVFIEGDPNIKVTSMGNASDTLELIKTGAYDCLISDYDMPDMDGITLAKKIRETSDIPIIIYTGRGSEEVAEQAYSVGINDYIRKENHPAHFQVLAKRIRHVVETKRGEKALRESEERYRALVDNSPNAISVTVGDKIVYANRSRAELAGVDDPSKLIGVSHQFQVSDVDRESMIERRRVRERGVKPTSPFAFRLVNKDGSIRNVVDYSSEIVYGGKKAVQHMLIDVTEHKLYEERLEALHRNELELTEAETLDEVAELTLNTIERTLGFDRSGFGIVVDNVLRFSHVRGVEGAIDLPLSGRGITVRAVKSKVTQFVPDIRIDGDYVLGSANWDYEASSEIAVPVTVGDEVAAVLNVESSRLGTYTNEDEKLLEILAEHVASTIRELKERERRKRYEARLEALHRHANELQLASTIHHICEFTLDAMENTLGFKNSSFQIVTNKSLQAIDVRGAPLSDTLMPLSGKGITVRAANTKRSILISDIRSDPDFVKGSTDSLSELAVPVIVDGETIGVINVESLDLDAFTEEDKHLLETLTQHVGSAIGRIKSLESEHSHKAKLEALSSHASKLARCIDLSDIAKITLEIIHNVIGADYGSFGIVRDGKLSFIKDIGSYESWRPELPLNGPGVTVRAADTGETQLVLDTRIEKDYLGSDEPGIVYLSELAVPVEIGDEVKAVINMESVKANAFTGDDKRLVELFAEHVASAISRIEQLDVIKASGEIYRRLLDSSLDSVLLLSGTKLLYVNSNMVKLLGYDDVSELIGKDVTTTITDDEREKIRQRTLSRQRGEPQPDRYELRLLRKDGKIVEVEAAVSLTEYEGKPAVLSFARDVTERKRYEKQVKALHDSATTLQRATDLSEVCESTLDVIESVIGFHMAAFMIAKGGELKSISSRGHPTLGRRIKIDGRGITAKAARERRSVLVNDLPNDPDFLQGTIDSMSELAVPVILGGEVVAVLNIENGELNAFDESDQKLLESLPPT